MDDVDGLSRGFPVMATKLYHKVSSPDNVIKSSIYYDICRNTTPYKGLSSIVSVCFIDWSMKHEHADQLAHISASSLIQANDKDVK